METLNEITVGELAAQDYRKVEVFKKYGVDFCCGGKKSLSIVCKEKGINQEHLERELHIAETATKLPSQNFSSWELGFLVDYIVNTHHKYVIQSMPLIFEYTQKVSKVHGIQHPETVKAATIFMQVMNELNSHIMKEENILFPYIKQLSESKKSGIVPEPAFGTIKILYE